MISAPLIVCSFVRCVCPQLLQLCLTLRPNEPLPTRLLCPWNFASKNVKMGCHALPQGIFLGQGLNLCLVSLALHAESLQLSHLGNPVCIDITISESIWLIVLIICSIALLVLPTCFITYSKIDVKISDLEFFDTFVKLCLPDRWKNFTLILFLKVYFISLYSSHIRTSLVALMVKNLPTMQGELSSVPGLGRSPGEGNGNPLQYSCLENSMDRGAWRTTVSVSSVACSCPALCNPMNYSIPGFPVHHQLPGFTQTHVHRIGDAIQPSHPLSSTSLPTFTLSQHQGLFQGIGSSYQVAKLLEFQLQHQSFQ